MAETQQSITIFTIPKPFVGHTGMIQYNAIKSWKLLHPQPQILLFGEEEGIKDVCLDLELNHVPEIQVNEFGTPLLDGVFRKAQELAQHSNLMYINADIILLEDFSTALEKIKISAFNKFLMIGRRIDVDVEERLNFDTSAWSENLLKEALEKGKLASVVCRDYFVFPKGLYSIIPPFAVGRGDWDGWMVYQAHQLGIPVIDATDVIIAIHQNHDYQHLSGNRGKAYVHGKEAQKNAQLAGGMHLLKGAETNWKMTQTGIKQKPLSILSLLFDLPRYLKLLTEIFL